LFAWKRKKLGLLFYELLQISYSFINHPSLNSKKMQDPRDIWEASISRSYRFTFQIKNDFYILRTVGTHDILKSP